MTTLTKAILLSPLVICGTVCMLYACGAVTFGG